MSTRSARYTPENYRPNTHWETDDFSYKWSDPNTPADYYQSYVTTGLASVDPTIWLFQRPDDIYTLGYAISVLHNGTRTNPHKPAWHSIRNNYRRNFECPAMYVSGYAQPYPFSSNLYFYSSKYSPDAIQYNIDIYQRFIVDFKYNDIVLYPMFDIEYLNGTTYTQVTGLSFAEVQEYFANYAVIYIVKLQINTYYGKTNELNETRTPQDFYPYIQFAGSIPTLSVERYQDVTFLNENGISSGVFLMPTNFVLFDFPNYVYLGSQPNYDYGIYASSGSSRSCIIPFDASFVVDYQKNATTGVWRFGIPDLGAVKNIMDRLGYNWAKTLQSAQTSKTGIHCTDPNIRCPVIDPETNQITTTAYEGEDIKEYAFTHEDSSYNWDTGAYDCNGTTIQEVVENINPEQPTVEEMDEVELYEPVIATCGGTQMWIMSHYDTSQFFKYLWDPSGTMFDDIVKGAGLLGNNPMDCVISLRMYPIHNLLSYLTYEHKRIGFGRTFLIADGAQQLTGFHVTSSNVIILNVGTFTFDDIGLYRDFRDYEPFSDYSLYIPFCGIVPLQAIECINTSMSIKMIIDLLTGSCTAVVFTNGVPYKYINGQIGIEVPVTGRDMSSYANTVLGAALGGAAGGAMTANKAKGAAGKASSYLSHRAMMNENTAEAYMASGNPEYANDITRLSMLSGAQGAAAGALGPVALGLGFAVAGAAIAGGVAALSNAPAVESVGSNTPATCLSKPMYPYLIVRRSKCWIPDNYNKLYGRSLHKGGKVSDFTGFSVFGNLKLENLGNATSEEKTLISELLTGGIYI